LIRDELPLSGHPRDGLRAGAGLDPVHRHLREHPVRSGKPLLAPGTELLPGGIDGCGVGRWVAGAHDGLLGVFSPVLVGARRRSPVRVFTGRPPRVEPAAAWRDPRSCPRCRPSPGPAPAPRIPLLGGNAARTLLVVGINAIFTLIRRR